MLRTKGKILTSLLFAFLIGILSQNNSSSQEITQSKPKVIAINPGHFPTDKLGGTGANGKDATEYRLNLKMAEYIKEEFENDPRFGTIISKDKNGIVSSLIEEVNNVRRMDYILERMKHRPPKIKGFKPGGLSKPTPSKFLRTFYSTRLVLEERTDIILNVHHDGSVKADSGYSVIISPYNSQYEESKNLALFVSDEFSKEQNISTIIVNDSLPDFSNYIQKNRMKLKEKGIAHRKLLPELGNYQIPAKKLTIIVEYNFAQKVSIHDDKYFKKMANATYRAILRYYKLNIYESMDNKFEIILTNSKTGYTVKPEQNRISDFVLNEIFTGIKKN